MAAVKHGNCSFRVFLSSSVASCVVLVAFTVGVYQIGKCVVNELLAVLGGVNEFLAALGGVNDQLMFP